MALYPANAGTTYPVLMLGNAAGIPAAYGCSYHYYFVIDADGIIRWRGDWDDAAVRGVIDQALAEVELSATDGVPAPATRLLAGYPNPFNPQVHLPYELGGDGGDTHVTLQIIDLRGRVVRTLVDGDRPRGRSLEAVWRGRDAVGHAVPSGTYVARLVADGRSQARLLSLVR